MSEKTSGRREQAESAGEGLHKPGKREFKGASGRLYEPGSCPICQIASGYPADAISSAILWARRTYVTAVFCAMRHQKLNPNLTNMIQLVVWRRCENAQVRILPQTPEVRRGRSASNWLAGPCSVFPPLRALSYRAVHTGALRRNQPGNGDSLSANRE